MVSPAGCTSCLRPSPGVWWHSEVHSESTLSPGGVVNSVAHAARRAHAHPSQGALGALRPCGGRDHLGWRPTPSLVMASVATCAQSISGPMLEVQTHRIFSGFPPRGLAWSWLSPSLLCQALSMGLIHAAGVASVMARHLPAGLSRRLVVHVARLLLGGKVVVAPQIGVAAWPSFLGDRGCLRACSSIPAGGAESIFTMVDSGMASWARCWC